jgi:hypothetical protein
MGPQGLDNAVSVISCLDASFWIILSKSPIGRLYFPTHDKLLELF